MRVKKVVNLQEEATRRILLNAATHYRCEVFAKMRVADVLRIEGSGIDAGLYSYALRAHFDFVVVDENFMPLFAVEFDGPSHQEAVTRRRDDCKNRICAALDFPLARVTLPHLSQKARGLDVLSWLVECWFGAKAMADAQRAGHIPLDEPIDPMNYISVPHLDGRFPLFRSMDARIRLMRLADSDRIVDGFPNYVRGYGADGEGAVFTYLHIAFDAYVMMETRMFLLEFGIGAADAAHELAAIELGRLVETFVSKGKGAVTGKQVEQALRTFAATYALGGGGCGQGQRLPGEPEWSVDLASLRKAHQPTTS